MATTTFKFGDITIHRVVEQEGPFFNPLEFFPSLTPEVLEENRGWMTEGGYLARRVLSGTCCPPPGSRQDSLAPVSPSIRSTM